MSREKVVFQAESAETVTENIEDKISETARENSQTDDGVFVKGMALPFGETSRNGVQYEKESVKENAEDLIGRPILFNHKQDFGTGHILNIEVTDDGMYYEGDINPNAEMPNGVTVAEAVKRGDIRSPSIQAFIEQMGEEADEDAVVSDMQTEKVKVADFIEISMVTVPGFPQASAMPEHLQDQGVKPITEAVGTRNIQHATESLENPQYNVGDFVEWDFGNGSSQGEVTEVKSEVGDSMSAGGNQFTIEEGDGPLYKIKEWDEEAGDNGEFTNNVVKFEDALTNAERPVAAEESISKEQYEFAPVPTHVLYDSEEDAMQRAENLGLDEIHEHEMSGQIYYMAGDNHDEWMEAVNRSNPTDNNSESTREEPFAGYDNFEDCVRQNQDKDDPEAYCGEIQRKVKNTEKTITEQTFDDYPEAAQENARMALEAKEDTGNPNDCGTRVGWERANQLDNGEALSEDTIGRMAAFERHEDNKEQGEEGRADCGWMMWNAWGGDEGIEWAQNKLDSLEEEKVNHIYSRLDVKKPENFDFKKDDIMSNTEDNDTSTEQVSEQNFEEFVASHMEGADVADITEALTDYNFTGLDQGEVAAMLAQEFDLDTGTVMDAIGQLEDMEGEQEEGDMDGDDDDMDEEEEEENAESEEDVEDKDREELEEKVKSQSEKIEELEERIETFLDEDEGTSKQNAPTGESEDSSIKRRPTFKGLLD